MNETLTLCIIDSDAAFSALLISRIHKYIPQITAFRISAQLLTKNRDLLLNNDFVLYNQHEISKEDVLRHCRIEQLPILIPLLSEQTPYPPKDVLMLAHEVETRAGIGRIPLPPGSSVQTCLTLSFVPPKEREKHVVTTLNNSKSNFSHIIRLDIMPGILMPSDPSLPDEFDSCIRSTGITELLTKIKGHTFSFRDIPSYLEPDPDGDLRFGRPRNSDDMLTCHSRTILHLIRLTHKYLLSLHEPSLLIVVADGLSFTRMRTLCKNLSHLEILTPLYMERDYMLCHEIDQLRQVHHGTVHVDYPFRLPPKKKASEVCTC